MKKLLALFFTTAAISVLFYACSDDEDGSIIEMGEYHENLKHGKWVKWDFTGVKVGEIRYDYGQKDGKWQIWDSKGTLRYVMFYTDGQRLGNWKIFDDTGALVNEENYDTSFKF